MINTIPILTTPLIHFSFNGRENVIFQLGSDTRCRRGNIVIKSSLGPIAMKTSLLGIGIARP